MMLADLPTRTARVWALFLDEVLGAGRTEQELWAEITDAEHEALLGLATELRESVAKQVLRGRRRVSRPR